MQASVAPVVSSSHRSGTGVGKDPERALEFARSLGVAHPSEVRLAPHRGFVATLKFENIEEHLTLSEIRIDSARGVCLARFSVTDGAEASTHLRTFASSTEGVSEFFERMYARHKVESLGTWTAMDATTTEIPRDGQRSLDVVHHGITLEQFIFGARGVEHHWKDGKERVGLHLLVNSSGIAEGGLELVSEGGSESLKVNPAPVGQLIQSIEERFLLGGTTEVSIWPYEEAGAPLSGTTRTAVEVLEETKALVNRKIALATNESAPRSARCDHSLWINALGERKVSHPIRLGSEEGTISIYHGDGVASMLIEAPFGVGAITIPHFSVRYLSTGYHRDSSERCLHRFMSRLVADLVQEDRAQRLAAVYSAMHLPLARSIVDFKYTDALLRNERIGEVAQMMEQEGLQVCTPDTGRPRFWKFNDLLAGRVGVGGRLPSFRGNHSSIRTLTVLLDDSGRGWIEGSADSGTILRFPLEPKEGKFENNRHLQHLSALFAHSPLEAMAEADKRAHKGDVSALSGLLKQKEFNAFLKDERVALRALTDKRRKVRGGHSDSCLSRVISKPS